MANLEYFSDEDVISFTLLDAHTVERLQRDGDIKLPRKKVDIPKDERWNTKQMSSKLLQGILAGDAIPTIANSLMQVIGNNAAAAVRNARTMVTGAENVGRLDSYEDLAEKGVVQKKVWIATADDRTRESHLLLDGEEVDIDKPFSNGLMYPADPSGDPAEVYNCRCSMRDHIVGFRRADGTISLVGAERDTTSHAGKIEDEIAQRGLEKVAVKENFEPVEITAADWESWAVDPEPYKAVISGEAVPNYSQGTKLTAEEKQRIESVALQMQERAETETVNFDTLFRGESYPTLKEAQEKYAVGNIVVNDTLTSYATSQDIAMEYAKQGEGVNVVITNTNIDNSFNGFVGVMTDPLDVGGSEEVITAKGMESKVFSSYYDKDTNTLYVGMTTDSVPAEAPAEPVEPTIEAAKPEIEEIEYLRYTSDDRKEVLATYSDQISAYSSDERTAIRRYVGDTRSTQYEYEKINNYLRNGGRISAVNEKAINSIDNAIENFEVKDPFTARRGLNLDAFQSVLPDINPEMSVDEIREALVGVEYVDKGYMSSSWNTWNGFSREAYLEIDVPQGRGYGCMVGNIPRDQKGSEDEFILRRNTHVEIYDVDLDRYERLIIHSRIVED